MRRPSALILPALCCAASLFFAAPRAHAQVSFDVPPAAESNAPITGKPYVAEKVMHTRRVLADGTATTHVYQIHEARNSQGRVLTELDGTLQPNPNGPAISMVFVTVRDPAAGTELLWNNLHHFATRTHLLSAKLLALRAQASGKPEPIPTTPEILGQRVINGRMATGRFIEKPIPAGVMGNATATVDKREWWTDEDLHLVVLNTSSSPLHGEETTQLRSLKLVEPDPAHFLPPDGYAIHDIAPAGVKGSLFTPGGPLPPPQPLDLAHTPALSHADAMVKLTSSDTADKAIGAAVLVKEAQASSDISLKAGIAYALARNNTGLPEALQLAEQALHDIEATSTLESPDKLSPADFERETRLGRYWETLGYIYFRQNHYDLARPYLQSAWLLDPRSYYGQHLGRLQEAMGYNTEAIRIYREALALGGSDNEKQTVRHDLARLSTGPDAQSGLQPIELRQLTLKDVKAPAEGTAFFDLIYTPATAATTPDPQVVFVNGTEALKSLASAVAKSLQQDFTLPDNGPEIVARRIELTCKTSSPSPCQIQYLSAQQARDLAGQ